MHITTRSFLTSGIAALGVGAVALAPIHPLPTTHAPLHEKTAVSLGVNLAAAVDPITPWLNTFKTAGANIGTLFDFYIEKPFPLLQTIGANIGTYFEELSNGQAGLIPEQIRNNIETFFQAPWDPGTQIGSLDNDPPLKFVVADGEYISDTEVTLGIYPYPDDFPDVYVPGFTPRSGYGALLQIGLGMAIEEGSTLLQDISPILNFLNTPYSGQLVGLLGPVLSPAVQLTKSFTAVGQFFQQGQILEAINELINIPANMTNAFLNGAGFLDLTGIINQISPLPEEIEKIGINLGGLLNAMPQNGTVVPGSGLEAPTEYSVGVGFDSVALGAGIASVPGLPNGPIGSAIGLGQFLSEQMLVKPPAPGQAVAAASAMNAAAAVAAPAPAVVEAPAVADAPAAVVAEAPAAVVAEAPAPEPAPADPVDAPVDAPAPMSLSEIEASEPEPVSTPAPSRSRGAATGNTSAAQNDSSDNAPAKQRGGRGR